MLGLRLTSLNHFESRSEGLLRGHGGKHHEHKQKNRHLFTWCISLPSLTRAREPKFVKHPTALCISAVCAMSVSLFSVSHFISKWLCTFREPATPLMGDIVVENRVHRLCLGSPFPVLGILPPAPALIPLKNCSWLMTFIIFAFLFSLN